MRTTPCQCVLCRSHRAAQAIREALADLAAAEEQRLDEDFDREGSLYWLMDEVAAVLAMPAGALHPVARKRLQCALDMAKPERPDKPEVQHQATEPDARAVCAEAPVVPQESH